MTLSRRRRTRRAAKRSRRPWRRTRARRPRTCRLPSPAPSRSATASRRPSSRRRSRGGGEDAVSALRFFCPPCVLNVYRKLIKNAALISFENETYWKFVCLCVSDLVCNLSFALLELSFTNQLKTTYTQWEDPGLSRLPGLPIPRMLLFPLVLCQKLCLMFYSCQFLSNVQQIAKLENNFTAKPWELKELIWKLFSWWNSFREKELGREKHEASCKGQGIQGGLEYFHSNLMIVPPVSTNHISEEKASVMFCFSFPFCVCSLPSLTWISTWNKMRDLFLSAR